MHQRIVASAFLAAAALLTPVRAHSWVELLRNIGSDGSFTGDDGYPRGWQNRSSPTFSDLPETWQVENGHGANPNLCAPGEQDSSSQGSVPRLQATPGSAVALLYQENGHVSIPSNNPAKPANRGTVYIYATQNPKAGEKYYDIYQKWNVAGNGGDGRGKLISTQNFDDGRCFQINNGAISKTRQAANPFTPSNPMGGNLWCQNNIVIPNDVDTSKLLTLYWVWKWDDQPHIDPKVWNGQNQTYTSCLDITLKPAAGGKAHRKFAYTQGQSPQQAGLGNIFNQLAVGNVFAVSAYTDGMYPTPTGPAPSAGTTTMPVGSSAAASTTQASTTAVASQCGSSAASVETVFIFGTSTGTIAPTGTGLSFSTETGSITSAASTSTGQSQASATASSAVTILTESSDGQPEASIGPSSTAAMVTQASDGQPEVSTAAPTQSSAATSQSSVTEQQSSTTISAAATSTISDNPVVIPVPTNPTASFTFEPSVTETATAITSAPAATSSGASTAVTSAVTAGASSSKPASSAAATASKTSMSASPSSGPCKATNSKRQSKIFGPLNNAPIKRNIVRRSTDRAHPRHWGQP